MSARTDESDSSVRDRAASYRAELRGPRGHDQLPHLQLVQGQLRQQGLGGRRRGGPVPSDSVRAKSANRLAIFVIVPRGSAAPLPPVKMRSRSLSMSNDGDGGGREADELGRLIMEAII